jgi:hypothetical protein
MDHYGMQSARINTGKSNENGSIESANGHAKTYIGQCLKIRGNNFENKEEYQAFLMECIEKCNLKRNKIRIAAERGALKPLPLRKAVEYKEVYAKVSTSSIIQVRNSIYSVPNKLIGETVLVRLYSDKLECYQGHEYVTTLTRVYQRQKKD